MKRTCEKCKKPFEAKKAEVARGHGRFCSLSCFARRDRVKEFNCECAVCGNPLYRNESKKKGSKSGLYFCNRKCKEKAQSIDGGIKAIQPPHFGTGQSSYREIAFKFYAKECNRCKWKEIPNILEVHHRDTNRENNTQINLEILCPTCHAAEHFIHGTGKWRRRESNSQKIVANDLFSH